MKIKKFRIKNYKSIKSSDWCYLAPDITILAGKNESGKTGILEALRDFDSGIPNIPDTAKPLDSDNEPVIEVCFEIENEMLSKIIKSINLNNKNAIRNYISEKGITVVKFHDGNYKLEEQFDNFLNKSSCESNEKHIEEIKRILQKTQPLIDITQLNITDDITNTKKTINQYIEQLKGQVNSIPEEEKKQKLNTCINKLY